MFVVNRSFYLLEEWYLPQASEVEAVFGPQFEKEKNRWVETLSEEGGAKIIAFVDSSCPCSRPVLQVLEEEIGKLDHIEVAVQIVDIHEIRNNDQHELRGMFNFIPSVPTMMITHGKHLTYVGPVNSGNLCTPSSRKLLAMNLVEHPQSHTVYNWYVSGCYCSTENVNGA